MWIVYKQGIYLTRIKGQITPRQRAMFPVPANELAYQVIAASIHPYSFYKIQLIRSSPSDCSRFAIRWLMNQTF
jgi:hypothetical protein